ncbi:unnamed protein product [Sphagnum balticum]
MIVSFRQRKKNHKNTVDKDGTILEESKQEDEAYNSACTCDQILPTQSPPLHRLSWTVNSSQSSAQSTAATSEDVNELRSQLRQLTEELQQLRSNLSSPIGTTITDSPQRRTGSGALKVSWQISVRSLRMWFNSANCGIKLTSQMESSRPWTQSSLKVYHPVQQSGGGSVSSSRIHHTKQLSMSQPGIFQALGGRMGDMNDVDNEPTCTSQDEMSFVTFHQQQRPPTLATANMYVERGHTCDWGVGTSHIGSNVSISHVHKVDRPVHPDLTNLPIFADRMSSHQHVPNYTGSAPPGKQQTRNAFSSHGNQQGPPLMTQSYHQQAHG